MSPLEGVVAHAVAGRGRLSPIKILAGFIVSRVFETEVGLVAENSEFDRDGHRADQTRHGSKQSAPTGFDFKREESLAFWATPLNREGRRC